MKKKIIIILGQTATGKSELSLNVAGKFPAEIINCDSMQVYKGMDIGTCKLSKKDRRKIPHHLFDIINPDEEYNAFMFAQDAAKCINDITGKNKLPVVVGGTGLYIKCLLGGLFKFEGTTDEARKELLKKIEINGLKALYRELKEIDPEAASKITQGDTQRIIRALEIYKTSGFRISELQKRHSFNENPYNHLKIGLKMEKEDLKKAIKTRVDQMFSEGLLEEVETLLKKGYKGSLKSLNSIGYKEAVDVLRGKSDIMQAKGNTYKRTKDYAKRQMTWFKKDKEINWFHPGSDLKSIFNIIESFI